MANLLYFWDGTTWQPVAGGGGGGGTVGPAGPPGADGHSVEVYGPQPTAPTAPAKGDMWLSVPAKAIGVKSLPPPNVMKLGSRIEWRPGKYPSLKNRRKRNG